MIVDAPLLLKKAAAAAADAYVVENSLKFDGSTSYLEREFGTPTDSDKWTLSCWLKLSEIPNAFYGANGHYLLASSTTDSWTAYGGVYIGGWGVSLSKLRFFSQDATLSTEANCSIDGVLRDYSAWYHLVVVVNGDNTGGEIEIWINGVNETPSSFTYNGNTQINSASTHYIGRQAPEDSGYLGKYLADYHFIDGQAKAATDFGETDSNGQWVPKEYTGDDYGTNGFHLSFTNTAGGTAFTDRSTTGTTHTITAYGNTTHTVAVKKVGDSSIRFDKTNQGSTGSGTSVSGLSIPDHDDWDFSSTGVFTAEGWFRFDNAGGASAGEDGGLISKTYTSSGHGDNYDWSLQYYSELSWTNNGVMLFYSYGGSASWNVYDEIDTDGRWYHIAVVSSGTGTGNVELFIDGVSLGTGTSGSYGSGSGPLLIGRADNNNNTTDFKGYADQIRVSNSARYTTGFTDFPSGNGGSISSPTAFTDDSNTLLLIQSNWNGGLGADGSGNTNDFTPTSLAASDQMIDTPSAGKNYCTINPLEPHDGTLSEGNLKYVPGLSSGLLFVPCTIGLDYGSGKWYFEIHNESDAGGGAGVASGGSLAHAGTSPAVSWAGNGATNSIVYNAGSIAQTLAAAADGDIVGVAVDLSGSNRTIQFYKNGSTFGTAETIPATWDTIFPYIGYGTSDQSVIANFGQDPTFNGNRSTTPATSEFAYTPPTDFKSLCTANLATPGVNNAVAPAFAVKAYDDGAGAKTFGGTAAMQPDLVWVKSRGSANSHKLVDSVRGVQESIESDTADAEDTESTGLTAFGSDGFTVGADADYSDQTGDGMVAWSWKGGDTKTTGWSPTGTITPVKEEYNTAAGFSIIKYVGSAMGGDDDGADYWDTIPHTLGAKPEMIIIKNLDEDSMMSSTESWAVYHKDLTTDYDLALDHLAAQAGNGLFFTSGAEHTSSLFTIRADDGTGTNYPRVNGVDQSTMSGYNFISYLFCSIPGYSHCGHYDGTGSTNFQYTGFRPAALIVKCLDGTNSWMMFDSSRDTHNLTWKYLFPDDSAAEPTSGTSNSVDFVSNGFVLRTSDSGTNSSASGYDYVFYAVAENPFKHANAR